MPSPLTSPSLSTSATPFPPRITSLYTRPHADGSQDPDALYLESLAALVEELQRSGVLWAATSHHRPLTSIPGRLLGYLGTGGMECRPGVLGLSLSGGSPPYLLSHRSGLLPERLDFRMTLCRGRVIVQAVPEALTRPPLPLFSRTARGALIYLGEEGK